MTAQILVVEDDADIRDTVVSVLREAGHTAGEATDGEEALSILRVTLRPLVVLLDLVMPQVSGIELLQMVASDLQAAATGSPDPGLARHAYVLMTANRELLPPPLALLLAPLAIPIIEKPFELDELLHTIDAVMRRQEPPPAPSLHLPGVSA